MATDPWHKDLPVWADFSLALEGDPRRVLSAVNFYRNFKTHGFDEEPDGELFDDWESQLARAGLEFTRPVYFQKDHQPWLQSGFYRQPHWKRGESYGERWCELRGNRWTSQWGGAEHFCLSRCFSNTASWESLEQSSVEMESALGGLGQGLWWRRETFGFLTADPVLAGAGYEGCALLHLPGLFYGGHQETLYRASRAMGLQIVDLGPLSSRGGLFWFTSNGCWRRNAGESARHFQQKMKELLHLDEGLTQKEWARNAVEIEDKAHRAAALLRSCRKLTYLEFLEFASFVRLGIQVGVFSRTLQSTLNYLLVCLSPERVMNDEKDAGVSADVMRAEKTRHTFRITRER